MNINPVMTKHYNSFHFLARPKNKAKTNPIKANLRKAKMNLSPVKTKYYEQKKPLPLPAKTNPIQTQSNPISNRFLG